MKTITVLARLKEERESGREGEGERGRMGEWENYQLPITNQVIWHFKEERESGREGERESGRGGEGENGRVGELLITNYQLSYLAFKLKLARPGFSCRGNNSLSKL
ncbi:hypothetical protein QUB37_00890 [Microcoleus sp. AT3-A2]|uniref:hypothetical protein n=1 Tax=Microcoleus sp. AT3-A2 TaxID=2818610 RepID=UPI002FD1A6AC